MAFHYRNEFSHFCLKARLFLEFQLFTETLKSILALLGESTTHYAKISCFCKHWTLPST